MSDVSELERQVRELDWRDPVPDELQSAVRMEFNEALAGGPNMNGDGGPTLTPNHALDCVWATQRITTLQSTVSRLREAIVELWHESEAAREVLHHYLGMTWEEYQSWAMGKDIQSMKDGK